MNLDEMKLRVHPGAGIVSRFAGGVLLVADTGPVLDEILAAAQPRDLPAGSAPGRRLARQVVALLYQHDPDEVPSFCLLAQAERGVVLVLHGDMEAVVSRPTGEERFTGATVPTWVDTVIDEAFDAVFVAPEGTEAPAADPRVNLTAGVVPAGAITLVSAVVPFVPQSKAAPGAPPPVEAQPVEAPATAADEAEDATVVAPVAAADDGGVAPGGRGARSELLMGLEPDEAREPLPVLTESATGASDEGAPLVEGILCSRRHFNDPTSRYCSVCGISMVHLSHQPVEGPRPPLGYIVLDDGSTFSLDHDYVIGREPEDDPDVVAGRARPLVLTDPDRSVSRIHAALLLEGWDVKIADRGSTNGSALVPPGSTTSVPLEPHRPTTLAPGTRVVLGQRTFLFDSHHKA